MIAIDTNVLMRVLLSDDPEQTERVLAYVERLAERGETLFVSHIVLCEVVWVLSRRAGYGRAQVLEVIEALLATRPFVVEAPDAVSRALDQTRSGRADFADYLIAERGRAAGCATMVTLDRALLREDGFVAP
jgi:predicted nucleic-acid-binding protein